MSETLVLATEDGVKKTVSKTNMMVSSFIKKMDQAFDGKLNDAEVIPISVDSKVLDKIIEYCDHYEGNTPAVEPISPEINEWDTTFIDMSILDVCELANKANYMEIESLIHLCSKKVANWLKVTNSEDIKKTFGITRDFTAQEIEEARKNPAW